MKKSKIKLLTATACLALVGTASAAWVYAGTATASANIGVKVASYASAGTIEVSGNSNLRVYLDKDSVSFVKENSTIPFKATYSKPDGFTDSEKSVTLTYQVVISKFLANFIKFADGVSSTTASDGSISTDYTYSWTSDDEITNLPELTWANQYTDKTVLAQKESYYTAIGMITGQAIGADFDQNKEWDAIGNITGYNIAVNFKAVVSE